MPYSGPGVIILENSDGLRSLEGRIYWWAVVEDTNKQSGTNKASPANKLNNNNDNTKLNKPTKRTAAQKEKKRSREVDSAQGTIECRSCPWPRRARGAVRF
jgi:hypothetical protein